MASFVVLVNGVPGAGKTTLSAELGRVLLAPVVSVVISTVVGGGDG